MQRRETVRAAVLAVPAPNDTEEETMLDPQVQALIERATSSGRPPLHTLSPQEAREEYRRSRAALQPPPATVASVEDRTIPGPHGPLRVRLYRARGTQPTEQLPAL